MTLSNTVLGYHSNTSGAGGRFLVFLRLGSRGRFGTLWNSVFGGSSWPMDEVAGTYGLGVFDTVYYLKTIKFHCSKPHWTMYPNLLIMLSGEKGGMCRVIKVVVDLGTVYSDRRPRSFTSNEKTLPIPNRFGKTSSRFCFEKVVF